MGKVDVESGWATAKVCGDGESGAATAKDSESFKIGKRNLLDWSLTSEL